MLPTEFRRGYSRNCGRDVDDVGEHPLLDQPQVLGGCQKLQDRESRRRRGRSRAGNADSDSDVGVRSTPVLIEAFSRFSMMAASPARSGARSAIAWPLKAGRGVHGARLGERSRVLFEGSLPGRERFAPARDAAELVGRDEGAGRGSTTPGTALRSLSRTCGGGCRSAFGFANASASATDCSPEAGTMANPSPPSTMPTASATTSAPRPPRCAPFLVESPRRGGAGGCGLDGFGREAHVRRLGACPTSCAEAAPVRPQV